MPQALIASVVAAIGLTGTAAAIASAVITLAVTVGLNFIAQALFGGGGTGKPSDGQQIVRVNVGSRVRHYGRVRVGGQLTFYESRNGTLYVLVTTGQGRLAAIVEYLLNGKAVTVNGAGLVTDARFKGAVSIFSRLGTASQAAYSQLSSAFSEWTADHRQRECSSFLVIARGVKAEQFSEVYEGNREPEGTITVDASLVYDPRKDSTRPGGFGSHRLNNPDTWEHSQNWALCFADYLAHPDGYGMGWDAINWTNIASEATICDQTVSTVDGRTVARWRASGSYKLAEDERRAVVKEFLKAGDGFMWEDADGLTNIRCGYWVAPTVHIPEKHIIGCAANLGTDAPDRANEVRVIYMEPRLGYVEQEAAPIINLPARIALGRPEVSRFDCYYCPDHNQAARIGKRILSKLGERWALTITTNLYGLNAIGQRFITLTIAELAITNLSFEVTALKIDIGNLNVQIGLIEAREEDFDFDAATEEGTPPSDVANTSAPVVIEPVSGLTLATVQVAIGGAQGVAVQATWTQPARTGLLAQVQYRPAGGDWLEMTVSQDDRLATSGVVSSGIPYEVQARHITVAGRPSAWSAPVTITPNPTEAAPSPPTDLTGNGGAGKADLSWRNPPEANFGFVRIYRNTVNDYATATALPDDVAGGTLAYGAVTDTGLAAGTYHYWFRSFNAAGTLGSAPAGPRSVVVS